MEGRIVGEPYLAVESDHEFFFHFTVRLEKDNGETEDVDVEVPIDADDVVEEAKEKAEIESRTSLGGPRNEDELNDRQRDQIRKYL